jgi:tryptophan-rich sensory protein
MHNSLWFNNLNKPFLQPPEWIFTPVWIILYGTLLIALILYSVTITTKSKKSGYVIFLVHMVFNLLWSPVFFILHKIDIAFFIILIMDITAFVFVKKFFAISKAAGFILIPYLAWILFATYLNLQFLRLN